FADDGDCLRLLGRQPGACDSRAVPLFVGQRLARRAGPADSGGRTGARAGAPRCGRWRADCPGPRVSGRRLHMQRQTRDSAEDTLKIVDGLRGLAAIYVMLYHVRGVLWIGWQEFAAHLAARPWWDIGAAGFSFAFRFGQEAVLLFFVISGFVIHYR